MHGLTCRHVLASAIGLLINGKVCLLDCPSETTMDGVLLEELFDETDEMDDCLRIIDGGE